MKEPLDRQGWPFWVQFDVDVLDQAIMPAVDSPGSPGISPDVVVMVLRALFGDSRCCGLTMIVFDPDFDSTGEAADLLVSLLTRVVAHRPLAYSGVETKRL